MMKRVLGGRRRWLGMLVVAWVVGFWGNGVAAPAVLLFEDDFNRGIPGWTAVQPAGTYLDGPMRWQYDIVSGAFLEQSNIYTDAAAASPSATAVMLVNDAAAGTNFVFRARLTAGDDDAFGLIFGYRDANNFHRVTFTRQRRTDPGYPWNGWNVDRKVNNVATNLFGHGTADHQESFFNTQYQPFDVTLSVSGANLFSLTVVDDPEGAATEYRLVDQQPLPGAANGRVGLMTWGMSGTALRGFRVANPELSPVALSGSPNALTEWTPVVTPRADGTGLDAGSGNGGRPIWSLALGANGAHGTLHENSDAFGGNDADGQVDFAAPSLVAGSTTWSNYVMTARILPADDDGHGMLLRYRDERNFVRIALRNQASGTGPRKGLSVQRVEEGVWSEVFFEESVTFDPVANTPYDLTAVVVDGRLQVQVVADPLGAARLYDYGPFDLGAALRTGQVGLFSWGMSRTEFDFVRVHGIDGVPLQVTSAFGAPEPAVGLHGYAAGTEVTAAVPSPVEESPGVRRVATGWVGRGSVPALGSGTQVAFRMETVSSLTWTWKTEVRWEVSAGAGGRVAGAAAGWMDQGSAVAVSAVPDAGQVFVGWAGDVSGMSPTLNLTLTRPLTVRARFAADSDGDGLPDDWERRWFGGLVEGAEGDPDGDGRSNRIELERGTDPRGAESLVSMDGLASRWEMVQRDPVLPGQMVVRDFGGGFRGVWENSNDFREAVDARFIGADRVVPGVSFEGPRMVIRTNTWNPAWTDFTSTTVFSVGDNDGNCVYFRYRDEDNWYRVTVCGENNNLDWRAPFGVTVQKRTGGVFAELAEDASIATDPSDTSFYKRVRVTVKAEGPNFEVRVAGWNAQATPPAWDEGAELVLSLNDTDHPAGRYGVGTWGQSGGGPATASNPVNAGALIEAVTVSVGGSEVFREDWLGLPLAADLPAGWERVGSGAPAGTWQVTAHGTILQTSNYSSPSTGTATSLRADGDGTVLLAPALGSAGQRLEFGFHPFDDDGIGFVYDFRDTNNYARVLFVSESTGPGRVPQGVSVSRRSGGVWSDLVVGDPGFVYANGRPFAVEFSQQRGECRLTVLNLDATGSVPAVFGWSDVPAVATNRFGFTCWGETDAHFLHARGYAMAEAPVVAAPVIRAIRFEGGVLRFEVAAADGGVVGRYAVEAAEDVGSGRWTEVATGQTGTVWETPWRPGDAARFFRLRSE